MINSSVIIDFDPKNVKQYVQKAYNIVAVDVLRATSSIIVAIAKGAKEVVACKEIEDARRYKQFNKAILIGERHAEIIPGFDFTNSPAELSQIELKDKNIAITTTTGTAVIEEALGAKNILIGSVINAEAVAKSMSEIGGKWAVIGAGTRGEFRPEDQVGCAMIVDFYAKFKNISLEPQVKKIVDTFAKDPKANIKMSRSSKYLIKINKQDDVDFVIDNINKYNVVPVALEKENKYGKYLCIQNN